MPSPAAARHVKPLVHERAFQTSLDDFLDIAMDERDDPDASRFHGRQSGAEIAPQITACAPSLLQTLGDRLRRGGGKPDFPSCRYLPVDDIDKDKGPGKVEGRCNESLPGRDRCSAHPAGIDA